MNVCGLAPIRNFLISPVSSVLCGWKCTKANRNNGRVVCARVCACGDVSHLQVLHTFIFQMCLQYGAMCRLDNGVL